MQKIHSTSRSVIGVLENIDLSKISVSRYSYRNSVETEIDELCLSIAEKGLLQPIIVRTTNTPYYEIVAGKRRYLACKKLGWRKILCNVMELDDKDAFEISLIENIHSKNIDPIDEATAFKRYVSEYGWGGVSELASKIGKSISYVDKRIRLLDLPKNIIESISDSSLNPSTAEELLSLKDKDQQSKLAELIIQRQHTTREARDLKNKLKNSELNIDEIIDFQTKIIDLDTKTQKSFDKAIVTLKVAMNKLASIISETEDNWMIYEILMQHKHVLHNQIDILYKEKKKL